MSTHIATGLYTTALTASFAKLHPRALMGNAVIFTTAVTAGLTTVLALRDAAIGADGWGVSLQIAFWLWLCVLFANFAEALAEGRGKARADSLRATKAETFVRVLASATAPPESAIFTESADLRPGHFVLVEAGDLIPTDAEVVAGVASVDESAITGESAPVVRESGGDRSSVTGGTRVVSAIGIAGMDRLVRANAIAKSDRAVEAAGDVDTLLLDKTGTITFGNRIADAFVPARGVGERLPAGARGDDHRSGAA